MLYTNDQEEQHCSPNKNVTGCMHYAKIVSMCKLFVSVCILMFCLVHSSGQNSLAHLNLFNELCKIWRGKALNMVLPEVSAGEEDLFGYWISSPSKLEYCKQQQFFTGPLQNYSDLKPSGLSVNILLAKSAEEVTREIQKNIEVINTKHWLFPEVFLQTEMVQFFKLTSEIYCYEYLGYNDSFGVMEKYSIQSQTLKSIDFGQYSKDTGLHFVDANKWERRQNFTGVTLISSGLDWKPMAEPIFDDNGKLSHISGYFPLLLEVIQQKLNFKIEWVLPEDGKWGSKEDDGNWNGLVGLLEKKKIDLVCAPVTITMERSYVMEFTFPAYHETYTLISQKSDGSAPNIWGYLIIFTTDAWQAIFVYLICITTSYFLWQNFCTGSNNNLKSDGLQSSIALVYCILIQMEYPIFLRRASVKLLHFTFCVFACVIFAFYSADLTSRLTVNPSRAKIKSFAEAYEQDFTVAVLGGSVTETMMASATKGSGMNMVWEDRVQPNSELFLSSNNELKTFVMRSKKNLAYAGRLFFMSDERFVFCFELSCFFKTWAANRHKH